MTNLTARPQIFLETGESAEIDTKYENAHQTAVPRALDGIILRQRNAGYKGSLSMESSTRSPHLDQFGNPFPDRIQQVLDDLTARFRRKFRTITDDVIAVEVLEQAGQQIMAHEAQNGATANLHGLAWVTIRNVAISRLRRGPHLWEQAMAGSVESGAALSRLAAVEGSPERIENSIFLGEVLDQFTAKERKIAIWKKSEYSSQFIAEKLGISVTSVDTTYSRLRQKARKLMGRGPWVSR